jgi:serine/threonine protein phosphatase PrpC
LRSAKDPEKICRKLIKQANQHGGQDNITAVVARFEGKGRDGALMRSLSDTVKLDDWERKKN